MHVFPVTIDAMQQPNSERVITPMPTHLLAAIDDFRFSERMPSRAEAIRRLLQAGLAALSAECPSCPVTPGPVTIAAMQEAEAELESFGTVDAFMAHLHADD